MPALRGWIERRAR